MIGMPLERSNAASISVGKMRKKTIASEERSRKRRNVKGKVASLNLIDRARYEHEAIRIEVDHGRCHSSRLAWQIAEIIVKGIGFPAKSEFDVLLLDAGSVQSHAGSHSDGMGGKARKGCRVCDAVNFCGRVLQ
jgi:hypothetical protein